MNKISIFQKCKNKFFYLNDESWLRRTFPFGIFLSVATVGIYYQNVQYAQPIVYGFWSMYALYVYNKCLDYIKQKKSKNSPPPEEFYG